MIAMAIINDPDIIIADEPTTALDVTVQAQILETLLEVKDEVNAAIILITHDLGVIAGMADRVNVMYAGRVGRVRHRRRDLRHAADAVHARVCSVRSRRSTTAGVLTPIKGAPPSLISLPAGLPVLAPLPAGRSTSATTHEPDLVETDQPRHVAACIRWDELVGLEDPRSMFRHRTEPVA